MKSSTSSLKRFWFLLLKEKINVRHIFLFAFFGGILSLSLPLGIQAIMNFLNTGTLSASWLVLVFIVLLGIVLAGILQLRQMAITENIEARMFTNAAFDFAFRIPRVRQEAIQQKYLPELVNRFFEILTVQKGLSKTLLDLSGSFLQIFFGLILLAVYHPLFILLGIVLVGILYLIIRITSPAGLRTSLEESAYKFEVAHWLEEIGRVNTTFKLIGQTNLPLSKTDELVEGYLDARKKHFRILKQQYSAMILFKVLVAAGLIILGSKLVVDQQINIGQFVAAEVIIVMIMNSVEKLVLSMNTIYDVLSALEKIGTVVDLPLERHDGIDIQESRDIAGLSVELKDMSFAYPGMKEETLSNLNLHIRSGEKVLIAGTEGAGKSTLLKLLAGMYESYSGQILFNALSMRSLQLEALRSIIGDNYSDANVFKGTIRENIDAGRDDITFQDVQTAARIARVEEFIQTLHKGYDTHINPEGKQLPSSIVRKLIMARALAQPSRLMLVEDTFGQFTSSERDSIFNAILDKANPSTSVIISNDPEIAMRCDKIIIMSEGKIIKTIAPSDVQKESLFKSL